MSQASTNPNDSFLTGRTAVVTGGCSGIGLASARSLAQCGARVAIGSRIGNRDQREVDAIRDSFSVYGQDVFLGHVDVCDSDSVATFVSAVRQRFDRVDILVNSAGIAVQHAVAGHPDAPWNQVIETNLTGAFRMTRTVVAEMIERGWGRIINIGSTAATVGCEDNAAYCASKAGLLGLTRCVALEGAPHGVSCVMISPTWVETKMMRDDTELMAQREGAGRSSSDVIADIIADNPQNRMIQPEEIAATVIFLCREEAFGMSMDNIQVTGGALW
ncbi:MAG: SDR family NAD(P)-dependent oxidoreductase [Acidiferrobacterales bacterium]|nr:SDR family NAD(P)-dependent oxidoreductase [Acidiferrobacterales bacterium]